MSTDPPPPPPPSPSAPGTPPPDERAKTGSTGWKVSTVAAVVMGLALSGTVYLLMDDRVDELRAERDAAREQADNESGSESGLDDLLGGLGDDGGALEDLLGSLGGPDGIGGLADFDPILLECLGGDLGGGGGEDSVPDADVQAQVAAIQEIVESERGLSAEGELDIEFVSLDEVRRRAVDITADELDPAEAAVDSRILASLGAVQPGTDLVDAQLKALDAGVGGFYNPETQQLVIGSEEMDGLGTFITAHELVHSLADSTIGLPDQEAIAEQSGSDAAYAALTVVEGDASLYSQRFIASHLPLDELLALQATSSEAGAGLEQLPHFVSRQLQFPYIEGMTFACDVFLEGGWEAVDDTYTDLPATTAQILFPDRYRKGEETVDVRDPAGPSGWDQLRTDTFGAADLLFLLEAPGDDESAALSGPEERVAAWAGGEVTVWGRDEQTAVALVLADRGGATPLCETVTDYYAAAFPDASGSDSAADGETAFEGPDQSAVVSCAGDEVALGIGPDAATARMAIS